MFAHVDVDNSGTISLEELRRALDEVGLPLGDDQTACLFNFLDTSGDGAIQIQELELAVRTHRRFRWDQGVVAEDEARQKEWTRTGVDFERTGGGYGNDDGASVGSGSIVSRDDPRLSPSIARLARSGGLSNSLPILGQFLMATAGASGTSLRSSSSSSSSTASTAGNNNGKHHGNGGGNDDDDDDDDNDPLRRVGRPPQSVWAAQAAQAQREANKRQNIRNAELFQHRGARRDAIRAKLHQKRAGREALERRTFELQ